MMPKWIIDKNREQSIFGCSRIVLEPEIKYQVLQYLSNARFVSAQVRNEQPIINAFTQQPILEVHGNFMSDGKWAWRDTLIIYVRDYDIALPQEFIDDATAFFATGGTTEPLEDPRLFRDIMRQPGMEAEARDKMCEWGKMRKMGKSTAAVREEYFFRFEKTIS